MRVYYTSSLDKFDNEETFMFYTRKGMIVIRSNSYLARVNEIFKIDDSNVDNYAISRGFDKVLETIKSDEYGTATTNWEKNFDTTEWKNKVHKVANSTAVEISNKVVHRIIVDRTVNSFLGELSEINYSN